MSSTKAFSFMGGAVQLGDGADPEVFTSISEVQKTDFTGSKADLADVTSITSDQARREFIATLIDSGDLNFTANFVPGDATQVSLQAAMDARVARNWKVVLPNSLGTFSFAGLISTIDRALEFDKEAKLTVKVKITGPIAFA